ncbi:hypothetical protein DFH09DRAFT_1284366 [Mycena vulgaris]|nr:hypothetical protein DFH09DRAFT_1284366 [Mycena vulgaris]
MSLVLPCCPSSLCTIESVAICITTRLMAFFGEENLPLRRATRSRRVFLGGGMKEKYLGTGIEKFPGHSAKETLQCACASGTSRAVLDRSPENCCARFLTLPLVSQLFAFSELFGGSVPNMVMSHLITWGNRTFFKINQDSMNGIEQATYMSQKSETERNIVLHHAKVTVLVVYSSSY